MTSSVNLFRRAPVQVVESQQNSATQLAEEFFVQCRNGSEALKQWLSEQDQQAIADSIRVLPDDQADIPKATNAFLVCCALCCFLCGD